MKTSLERPLRAGDDFWLVIERCLVEFHGWKPDQARKRVDQFEVDLAPVRAANEEDLILHDEPFEIAGDMAGRYLDLAAHRQRYDEIIDACQREVAARQAPEPDARAEARPTS